MKLIFKTILATIIIAGVPLAAANAGSLFTGQGSAVERLKTASTGAGLGDPGQVNPSSIVQRIVNAVIGILGVVAVLLIVYAGGTWLTAAGNEQKVEQAKKIIKSTVVGMIIVGLAYAITLFIISLATTSPGGGPSPGQQGQQPPAGQQGPGQAGGQGG